MTLWMQFTFWLFRKFHDGVPGPKECEWAVYLPNRRTKKKDRILFSRCYGNSIADIAIRHSVSRYRVQYILIRECYRARNPE